MDHAVVVQADLYIAFVELPALSDIYCLLLADPYDGLNGYEDGIFIMIHYDLGATTHAGAEAFTVTVEIDGQVVDDIDIGDAHLSIETEGEMATVTIDGLELDGEIWVDDERIDGGS